MVNSGSLMLALLLLTCKRRRIVGDFTMRYIDRLQSAPIRFDCFSGSNYDSQLVPVHLFRRSTRQQISQRIILRRAAPATRQPCTVALPDLMEFLVALAISMDRDASVPVRMQPDIANQATAGVPRRWRLHPIVPPRNIVFKLRQHLVEIGA